MSTVSEAWRLVRADALKLRTSRPARLGFAAAMLAVAALACLYGAFSREVVIDGVAGLHNERVLRNVYLTGYSSGFLVALLLGISLVAGESRQGILRYTLLACPRRSGVVAGKAATAVLAGLGLGAVLLAISVLAGVGFASAQEVPNRLGDPALARAIGACLVAFVPWMLIGLGVGLLIDNQVVASAAALVWVLFAEVLLAGMLSGNAALAPAASYLLHTLSATLANQSPGAGIAPVPTITALGLLLVYGTALVLAGGLAFARRDIATG